MAAGNFMGQGFKPGQSGNPNGRPRGVERVARELADSLAGGEPFAGLKAVMKLAFERMTSDAVEDRDRKAWAQLFVERAYGKARETVDINTEPTLTDEEYQAEIREIVRESVATMSPEERMKLLADPAPSSTVQ